MSTETIKFIRDVEKVGEGGGEVRGERGWWGGGRGRLYTCRCTVTTRITPGLRWAVMRAVLMFHSCEGQSHKTVSTDHNFRRKGELKKIWTEVPERRAEADLNQSPSAYQPDALPLGHTNSQKQIMGWAQKKLASWHASSGYHTGDAP